ENNLQQALFAQLDELNDARHTRMMVAEPEFDAIIWAVLIAGGCVLVVFTYFFGVENLAVQIVMTVMVTLTLALNLCLVIMFGYPYSGDVRVSPAPFVTDVATFEREMKE